MANLMYWAWSKHGILPSKIYELNSNELKIIETFYRLEYEQNN